MHSCCSVCAVWVHPWQEPLGLGVCRALPAPGAPFALLHTRINSKLQIDKGLTMPGRLLSFVVAFWDLHSSGTLLPKQAVLPAVNSTKPHLLQIPPSLMLWGFFIQLLWPGEGRDLLYPALSSFSHFPSCATVDWHTLDSVPKAAHHTLLI